MNSHEKLIAALTSIGVDTTTRGGRDVLHAVDQIIGETLQAKIKEGADTVIARERNNAWRQLREITKSLDGDVEEYIEYGFSYGDEPPRAYTFTPYYDTAMSELSTRKTVHGTSMGEIRLRQRRNVMTSSPWIDAVRPPWNPLIDESQSNSKPS